MDKKNAAGVSKDLRKSELIDWRNHETLNNVTKTAIQYFESSYCFSNYMEERNHKESKIVKKEVGITQKPGDKNQLNSDSEMNSELEEEEIDAPDPDWNRAMAEQLYSNTKHNLNLFYAPVKVVEKE